MAEVRTWSQFLVGFRGSVCGQSKKVNLPNTSQFMGEGPRSCSCFIVYNTVHFIL